MRNRSYIGAKFKRTTENGILAFSLALRLWRDWLCQCGAIMKYNILMCISLPMVIRIQLTHRQQTDKLIQFSDSSFYLGLRDSDLPFTYKVVIVVIHLSYKST